MALSKTQNKRLGALLSVMFNEEVPSEVVNELIKLEFLEVVGNDFFNLIFDDFDANFVESFNRSPFNNFSNLSFPTSGMSSVRRTGAARSVT